MCPRLDTTFFLKNEFQWEGCPHRKVKGGENDRSTSLRPSFPKKEIH
jgi:hypothetical protein